TTFFSLTPAQAARPRASPTGITRRNERKLTDILNALISIGARGMPPYSKTEGHFATRHRDICAPVPPGSQPTGSAGARVSRLTRLARGLKGALRSHHGG